MLKIEGLHDESQEDFESAQRSGGVGLGLGSDTILKGRKKYEPGTYIVTQIRSGVRDQNRVNIYINDKYDFSLDLKQVVDLKVKVGRKLSENELQELRAASEFGKLYQRALEWALMRPRSLRETRDYLKRRQIKRSQTNRQRQREEQKLLPEIQDQAVALVIERLVERGFVDDERFAEYYIENRFIKKGISRRRLEQELRKKGISEMIIRNSLTNSARSDENELAKMIKKKRRKYDREKLVQYLVRQGFDYYSVVEAVDSIEGL